MVIEPEVEQYPVESSPLSPKEFLQSLPKRFKQALWREFFRELASNHPDRDAVEFREGDALLGIVILPHHAASAADAMYCSLDPTTRASLMQPYLDFNWNDCLSPEEVRSFSVPPAQSPKSPG